MSTVEMNASRRWEESWIHHPKTIPMWDKLVKIALANDDYEVSEPLMYYMDIYFELEDENGK